VVDTHADSHEAKAGERLTDRIAIGVLTDLLHRDLVDEVIAESGKREQRVRLLPARVVVYFVLAMCLFYQDGYEEVMRKLVSGLRFMKTWRSTWRVPTTGAITQARVRLGEEPLQLLFERVAAPMARPGTACGRIRAVPAPKKYSDELRERAVRLVFQIRRENGRTQGVIPEVARKLGIGDQSLRTWVKASRNR
jgi:transposase IS4-like protein/transposase